MNKLILSLIVGAALIITTNETFAQTSFSHSIGGGIFAGNKSGSGQGITYSPRLNFMELGDEMTLSAGTHLSLGFSGTSNSQSGSSGSFLIDLPIVAEMNFGCGSNNDSRSSFGGFIGAGFGYNKMASSDPVFGTTSMSSSGLLVNGGIRALIKERPIGLRVSYLLSSKQTVLGIGIFYMLGME